MKNLAFIALLLLVGFNSCSKDESDDNSNSVNTFSASVTPNPTSGEFEIQFDKVYTSVLIEMFNANGKIVETFTASNTDSIKLTTTQQSGVYVLRLTPSIGSVVSLKLVLER